MLLESVGYQVTGFSQAELALQALGKGTFPDCLVTDVRMPGMGGIQLHETLANEHPTLPVIIVTGHADVPMAVDRMKAGAADFLSKPFRDQELLDAISRALRPKISIADEAADWQEAVLKLTAREQEVLEQLCEGHSSKVIARNLNISVRTAEVHRANVYKKLGVKSNAQLLLKAPR